MSVHQAGRRARPPAEVADDDVQTYVRCLRGSRQRSRALETCRRVDRLRQSASLRPLMEALLLTDADYSTIATHIGVEAECFRLFGSLFYDVRDAEGHPRPFQLIRIGLHLDAGGNVEQQQDSGVAFKKAALRGGYPLLVSLLPVQSEKGTSSEQGRLDRTAETLVEQELIRRLLMGEMRNADLIRLRGTQIAGERMLYETGQKGSASSEGMELVQKILQACAPSVVAALEEKPDEAAVERLRKAEQRIAGVQVEDRGPAAAHADINAQLAAKFCCYAPPFFV